MSYRKGSENNIQARLKREWRRAEKKRRIALKRQVATVAMRLLGEERLGVTGDGFFYPNPGNYFNNER
jgi:hypothetical protein